MVSNKSKATFEQTIKAQIKSLRKQLDQGSPSSMGPIPSSRRVGTVTHSYAPLPPKPDMWEAARSALTSVLSPGARAGPSDRNYVL